MTGQIEAVWQRRTYERHLDLLLAEELECNPQFLVWFVRRCDFGSDLPVGLPTALVRVGEFDTAQGDSASGGEDDLCVHLTWEGDATVAVILVEDKLDAVLQPQQVERYEGRVSRHRRGGILAAGAFVAPGPYLNGKSGQLGAMATFSIEDIVDELRLQAPDATPEIRRRLEWRARQLMELKAARRQPSPTYKPTEDLRDWISAALEAVDATVRPDRASMRTIKTTWLYFLDPPALVFKVGHGVIDIYLRDLLPDDPAQQQHLWNAGPFPEGFRPGTDTKGNLLMRWGSVRKRSIDELWAEAGPTEEAHLHAAVRACVEGARWARQISERHERPNGHRN